MDLIPSFLECVKSFWYAAIMERSKEGLVLSNKNLEEVAFN